MIAGHVCMRILPAVMLRTLASRVVLTPRFQGCSQHVYPRVTNSARCLASANSLDTFDWGKVAENYESVSPFSKLFAEQCIEMLQIPDVLNRHRILDIAAGTGTFSLTIASDCLKATDSSILATDVSSGMVEIMRHKSARDIKPEIRSCMSFAVMDGQNLEVPSNTISHLACVFGIMFFPDRLQGLREMHRVLEPSASAAIAAWKSVNMPRVMEHVAVAEGRVAPAQLPLPFPQSVHCYADAGDLTRDLIAAGFPERAIAVRTVERELVIPTDAVVGALAINPAFEALGIPRDAVRRRLDAHPDAAGPDHFTLRGTAHIALAKKAAPA